MAVALGIFCAVLFQTTLAQMGFGGGGYCATCAMKSQGLNSPGFGYGEVTHNFGK